ncbi:MATE family efflux transporter [candidate division KSB1 bacterium]|nr:MATE family efflux transporter [candidate division KSB1 bacterium]
MKSVKRRDLTTGNITKNLWILALPMMATNALQTLFNVVDMIFVGRLGPSPIAAVSIVGVILMIPFSLVLGISIATGAMVSRYFGAKEYDRANHIALQSLHTGFYGGLIIMFLGIFLAPSLISLFGVDAEVHHLATIYIRIIFISSVAMALQFLTASIFQAVGDAHTALWIMIGAVVFNIITDPLLIFGIGPFPRLEVAGAAWATTISRFFGMIIALIFLFAKKTYLRIKWEGYYIDFGIVKRLLKIGLPGSLQMTLRSMSGIIMMGIVAGYGTFALAAYGIGIRIDMLVMMPGFGLAGATGTLVGQNLGALKPDRAVKSAWSAVNSYLLIMICAGMLFYIFAGDIFHLFNDNAQVISNGLGYVRILVFSYPFLAVAIVLNRALGGAGETVLTMLVTAGALFGVAIPLSFVLPKVLHIGVKGIWLAIVISNIVNAIVVMFIFILGKWKYKNV